MEDATTFLATLYPQDVPENHRLLVWVLKGTSKTSHWLKNVEQAENLVTRAGQQDGNNVYLGVGLSPEDYGPNQRCKADAIAGIPALAIDVDIAGEGHKKKNYPPDQTAALELINATGFKPTLVIHSGHGLQAWWCFNEPWLFTDAPDREKAAALAKAWSELIKKHAATKGWTIDSTFDLARVMRVPGTTNHKGEPVPVQLLQVNDARYEPRDLLEACTVEVAATEKIAAPVNVTGLKLDPKAEPPFDKWTKLITEEPLVALSWAHRRTEFPDQSCSSYDMSLAFQAVRAGWSDQEVADLLIAHRRYHGSVEKALRTSPVNGQPGYVAATIAAARTNTHVNNSEEKAVKQAGCASDDRKASLDYIHKFLSPDITGLLKIGANPSEYRLQTSFGPIDLGPVSTITSYAKFRDAVADATATIPQRFKPDDWDNVARELLKIVESVHTGGDGSDDGICRRLLNEYLQKQQAMGKGISEFGEPFINKDGKVCITCGHFHHWIDMNHRYWRVTPSRLVTLLRLIGCVRKAILLNKPGSKRTTKSFYVVPTAFDSETQELPEPDERDERE